jgi:D-cysteine desulfhydrase
LEAKPEVYDGNLLLSSILGAEIHFTAENRKGEDGEKLKTNWRTQEVNVS